MNIHDVLSHRHALQREHQQQKPAPVRLRFTVNVVGSGETRMVGDDALPFNALLLERPTMTFGTAFTGAELQEGSLPLATACVLSYLKSDNGLYYAAEMGFKVLSNDPLLELDFFLIFEAPALRTTVGLDRG